MGCHTRVWRVRVHGRRTFASLLVDVLWHVVAAVLEGEGEAASWVDEHSGGAQGKVVAGSHIVTQTLGTCVVDRGPAC